MKSLKKNYQAGITIIELVVVLAILFIILSTVTSIFLSFMVQQRKILQNQELLNQSAYAMEYMGRTTRTAAADTAGTCLSHVGDVYNLTNLNATTSLYQGIKFLRDDGICQQFFLDTDGILKEIKNGATAENMVSSKFTVKYIGFLINGNKNLQLANQTDLTKPRVTIIFDVKIGTDTAQQEKIIQTTVSQTSLHDLVLGGSPSSTNYVQDVYVTTEGLHIVGGPGCNVGYISRGTLADCGGGGCQGNQQICVKYDTSTTSTIHDATVTTEGAHIVGGPACSAGYTSGGTIADCGGGGCQGNQKICRSLLAGSGLKDMYITTEGLHLVGGPGCNAGYTARGTIADCGAGGCQGNQQICVK